MGYLGDQKSLPMPAIPAYKSKNALILKKKMHQDLTLLLMR